MAQIKPFKCVRPAADMAATIAALPYDVYNREEAKEVVKNNNYNIKLVCVKTFNEALNYLLNN